VLTGLFVEAAHEVDMGSLIDEIIAAEDEFYERQRARKERDDE
ncbi:serine protein kinase RIO, partial [Pectobacterium sp. 13-115]|nr:serine protein kinase RIO [Pectobacterium jejuense]